MQDIPITELPSAAAIADEDWGGLAPTDDPMWTKAYFLAMENADLGIDELRYLAAHVDGRLVAMAPVFWFRRLALDRTSGEPWRKGAETVRRIAPGFMRVPALFCGHPMGRGRILTRPEWQDAAWQAFGLRLHDLARSERLRYITMKDFVTADCPRTAVEGDLRGFFNSESLPDAVLQLDVSSFDDYLASLRPKPRRNARSKQRKFAASEVVRLELHDDFVPHISQMMPLYGEVYRRAEIALDHLNADFFYELATSTELDSQLVACWRGDEMIGFVVCLYTEDGAVALRTGLNYSYAREHNVWFALHYAVVEEAIKRGIKTLNFCQTTYPAKREIGCQMLGLSNFVSHVNPLMRIALQGTVPLLHRSYRNRNGLPPVGQPER